jgi:Fe(3+) dicitrate transport protein
MAGMKLNHVSPRSGNYLPLFGGALVMALAASVYGQAGVTTTNTPQQLPDVVVQGEAEYQETVQPMFLPEVEGTKIYSGKKASVIDLDALPKVQANNYRQALSLTPGLLISEETTPLVSIGYRGIGEPHRTQFMNVLKDGIPIHADPIGYPEAYYTPPLETVDRVEFLRGGAGLMYGPQPAGALNYVTYQPRRDREFAFRTENIFGTDNLFGTYNAVDGTIGRLGYYAYFNHRQSDGFRTANSDYQLDGGHFKVVLDADTDSRWTLAFDAYEEEHGEPGGLNFGTGPNDNNYNVNRDQATRQFDRFRLRRYVPSLSYDKDFSEQTQLSVKAWGGYYDRWSKRQRGGGFGTFPNGPTSTSNDIERQEFYNFGTEARLRHDYTLWGDDQTFAGGISYFHSDSPRTDRRGSTPNAEDGVIFRNAQRGVNYGSVFFENKFTWEKLSVTPGFRLENIAQDISLQNFDPVTGLFINSGENNKLDIQPLLALGVSYQITKKTDIYANVSQSYRPTIFTESLVVPVGSVFVSGDLPPSLAWTYEIGYRGTHEDWLTWDTSLFLVDLDNKLGGAVTSGGVTVLGSVGRSINYGWDAAVEFDLVRALDSWNHTDHANSIGSFSLYANASLLEAELHGGPFDGNRPQYSPDYLLRAGGIYRFRDRVKVALLGTFVDQHFATDNQNPTRSIPAYMVWDFTVEAKVYRDYASVMAGINNLFDEDYYSRIRSDGIDPAYGRNFYAGFAFRF